jgi:AcrR family transcriptional regulator
VYDASGSQDVKPARSPRDERLSRAVVVNAAIEIARRDGLSALSMRRLAEELGVSTMAAYRHVASKDTLVDDVLEAIVETISLETTESDWQKQIEQLTVRSFRVFLEVPGITDHLRGRALVRPAVVRWIEALIQPLVDAGIQTESRAGFTTSLVWLLRGATRLSDEWNATIHALEEIATDGPEDSANMRSGRDDLGEQQAEDLLVTGIHLLLGGLTR